MKVYWEHPKQLHSDGSLIAAGQPFEMADAEALARFAAGEIGLLPVDPAELARLQNPASEPEGQDGAVESGATSESSADAEAVSVAPRARRKAPSDTAPEPGSEG